MYEKSLMQEVKHSKMVLFVLFFPIWCWGKIWPENVLKNIKV